MKLNWPAVTAVPAAPPLTRDVHLAAARPNPSAGVARIGFSLTRAANVMLAVYDVSGREVKRLLDDAPHGPGAHEVRFDTRTLPNGLYLYRLRTAGAEVTRKLVVTR